MGGAESDSALGVEAVKAMRVEAYRKARKDSVGL